MRFALGFLPLVAFTLVVLASRTGRRHADATLRDDILSAALLLGVAVAVFTEAASPFHAVSLGFVVGFWVTAALVAGVVLAWRRKRFGPSERVTFPDLRGVDGVLVAGIVGIALVLLVVAWLAPPQSSDSIGYHMSRVMHWMQAGSIAHYPTHDPPQLFEPPFAEIVRLHFQVLTGGDRAGQLLQWLAAMGSLAGVSLVARDLGGGRHAQILAAVVAVTLPIGVTQASSGKNGWVETLWLVSLVHFGATSLRAGSFGHVVAACAALGLALMTKISSWLFAPPLVALAVLQVFRTRGGVDVRPVAIGAVIAAALVLPYLGRNLFVYGHPLVDPVYRSRSGLGHVSPAVVASNVVRNAAVQLGTSSPTVNAALTSGVLAVHRWIGAKPSDRKTTDGPFRIDAPSRIEERASSPLHLFLLTATGLALIASRRLRGDGRRIAYLAALGAGYVLYCAAVKWQPSSPRLLMPLLVLAAPIVAVVGVEIFRGRLPLVIAMILVLGCYPYATNVFARPLTFQPRGGILATPRRALYFARVPTLRDTYESVAREVLERGTRDLGVLFRRSLEPEYLLWVLLADADPPVRIEHVLVRDASARIPFHAPFEPDVVAVFAGKEEAPEFEPEIEVAGDTYKQIRTVGTAALYERGGQDVTVPPSIDVRTDPQPPEGLE